jgi:putative thioredoxin
MGQLDQAEALLNNAPEVIASAPEIEAARAQIELARQAEDAGPLGELSAAVEADPANHQARFDYALALHAAGKVEEAVEQLLELFRRDREWNDGCGQDAAFHDLRRIEADRPDRAEGAPPLELDDICLIQVTG